MRSPLRAYSEFALSLFIAFALIACSDGGGRASLASLGVDDGASEGLTKSATVSAEKGGTISLATGAKVEIPGGAVSANVQVSMERPADGKALDLVNRLPKAADRIASAPYVLTPHGTKFEEDVTVTLPISNKDAQEVSVAWLEDEDDQVWKVLSEATVEGETAHVKVKHFSVLLLVHDVRGLSRLDAGTGSEGRDAGDIEVDSGAETRDAETPDEMDADVMVEPDAGASGMDASDTLDASSGSDGASNGSDAGGDALDASTGGPDASAPADADTATDAPQLSDGSVSVDGAVFGTSLQQRLTDCDLITEQGFVSEPVTSDPVSRCRYRCLLAANAWMSRASIARVEMVPTASTRKTAWPAASPPSSCAPMTCRATSIAMGHSTVPTGRMRKAAIHPTSSVRPAIACRHISAVIACPTARTAKTSWAARGTPATGTSCYSPTSSATESINAATARMNLRAARP